ncbi:MAG: hypothetical protein ACI4XL_02265 [Bacillus sp. (in: firmicutes)]
MKLRSKLAFSISLFILIGFPMIFSVMSLVTGNWGYLMYSSVPSFFTGFSMLIFTFWQYNREKKETT